MVMFEGGVWLTFTKNPYYLGDGHWAADVAVGTLYYPNHSFDTGSLARVWIDSIPIGGTDFMFGFGSTYQGESTWNGHLHAGTGRVTSVNTFDMWTFGDTVPPRTTCAGDSGGGHGAWYANFMLYGLTSGGDCGVGPSYLSIATRMRYNLWVAEEVIGTCTTYSVEGQYYKRCW